MTDELEPIALCKWGSVRDEVIITLTRKPDDADMVRLNEAVRAFVHRLAAAVSAVPEGSGEDRCSSGAESAVSSTEQRGAPLDQIKHMTDRFLGWRLPKDFQPDNGIRYTRPGYAPSVDATPYGTNLFDARQAEAMVRYIVEGLPSADDPEGCAEREVGRYVYKLIAARIGAKAGTPEGGELAYLARIVSDVEEYGADELAVPELSEPAPEFAHPVAVDPEVVARLEQALRLSSGDDHWLNISPVDGRALLSLLQGGGGREEGSSQGSPSSSLRSDGLDQHSDGEG